MIRSSGSKELLRPDLLKLIERADFRTFVIYSEAPPWDRPVPWRSSPASPRAGCTIHNECVTDHKACAWTAKPKNGSGDLLGLTKSPNRLISHDLFHCVGFLGEHVCNHRRIDGPRAYSVDTDAPGGVFESGALGQSEHPVLAGVIHCLPGHAHESADGRAVDDGATSLLAHLDMDGRSYHPPGTSPAATCFLCHVAGHFARRGTQYSFVPVKLRLKIGYLTYRKGGHLAVVRNNDYPYYLFHQP